MGNHAGAQLAAIEALGEIPEQRAADVADRWSGVQAPRELRKAARRALLRLAQQGIHPTPAAAPEERQQSSAPERIRRAVMSAVNGDGTRLLSLLIDVPMSGAYEAMAVVSQRHGLMRFDTTDSSTRKFARAIEEEAQRFHLPLVDVPALYARHLLAEAAAASRAAGRGLPSPYHSFRELLPPPGEDEPEVESPVYGEPDADAVRYRPEPLEASLGLLERPEFADWQPAQEEVLPLAREWEEAETGTLALPPAAVAQRREATMGKLIALVLGPGGAPGFRRRLEDNAYVLLRSGAAREGRRALTAALSLDPPDIATASAQPLVRSIAARALDAARAQLAEEAEAQMGQLARLAQLAGLTVPPAAPGESAGESPAVSSEPGGAGLIGAGDAPGLTTTPSGLILPR